jgi:diguanylate cyclase (GGDEF)-like protein
MLYLIAATISIIIATCAFAICKRVATLTREMKFEKNWVSFCVLIVFLLLSDIAYGYILIADPGKSIERIISAVAFFTGSIIVLFGTLLIYTVLKEMQRLKEEARIYQKYVEEELDKCEAGTVDMTNAGSPTGLYDKQYLHHKLDEEITRALRQQVPLYLIVFNIDNDELPENIIQIIGNVITSNIRYKIDTGFYCDGKEFAITLPYTIREQAITIAKRILLELNSWNVNASMGLVSCNDIGASTSTELIKIAAIAVGEANAEGGNRIRLLEKNVSDRTEYVPPKRNKRKHLKLIK